MKKIESDMGIALFQRDKRRLTLNAAGKVVADYARRILMDEREMLSANAVRAEMINQGEL